METYQKDTDSNNGVIRLAMDQENTVVTKLFGQHRVAKVKMTRHQADQIAQFLKEGLQQIEGMNADDSDRAVSTVCHLLDALETLQTIDPCALAIPGIGEKWKDALQQGWEAQSTLSSMLAGWRGTLSTFQQRADESFEKSEP